jgi:hypothetical protein
LTRVSSIFSQILQLIPRLEFESAVRQQKAERHARGFSSWGQFIAMLFCQLGHAKSLREICGGLAASEGKLRHLGLPAAPARSSLAYANGHRPWQLQQTVFEQLLGKCQILAASQPGNRKKKKFRFKNPLLSLDATVIDLCATMFDWAKFRLTKGAVKLHLLLDHDGYLPSFAVITEGKTHEVRVAREMQFAPGAIVVFDRGYTDYQWFVSLTTQGVYFVTRLKENADYGVVEKREVPQRRGVLRDEVIFFYKLAQAGRDAFFRRIEFYGEILATTIDVRLVPFESGGSTAPAIVCLPRPMDVDRRFFPTTTDTSKLTKAIGAAAELKDLDSRTNAHSKSRVTTRFSGGELRQHPNNSSTSQSPTCPT